MGIEGNNSPKYLVKELGDLEMKNELKNSSDAPGQSQACHACSAPETDI